MAPGRCQNKQASGRARVGVCACNPRGEQSEAATKWRVSAAKANRGPNEKQLLGTESERVSERGGRGERGEGGSGRGSARPNTLTWLSLPLLDEALRSHCSHSKSKPPPQPFHHSHPSMSLSVLSEVCESRRRGAISSEDWCRYGA